MKREIKPTATSAACSFIPHPSSLILRFEQGGEGPVPPATTLSYWGEDSFTYDPDQTDPQESLPGSFPSHWEPLELNRLPQPHR